MGCRGLTKRGEPCGFKLRRGFDLCINHDPTLNPKLASEKAAEASRRVRAARTSPLELLGAVMSLTDRTSIQAAMDVALRLYLGGHIKREKYRDIIHGCSAAAKNFDKAGDTLAGPKPQVHEWNEYFTKVRSLLESVDPLLEDEDGLTPDPSPDAAGAGSLFGGTTDEW